MINSYITYITKVLDIYLKLFHSQNQVQMSISYAQVSKNIISLSCKKNIYS